MFRQLWHTLRSYELLLDQRFTAIGSNNDTMLLLADCSDMLQQCNMQLLRISHSHQLLLTSIHLQREVQQMLQYMRWVKHEAHHNNSNMLQNTALHNSTCMS